MSWVFRTMIVPAQYVDLANALASGLAGEAGDDMWGTWLSPDGGAPATHYIASGMIEDTFASLIADPAALYAACQQAGAQVTPDMCTALVEASHVSDLDPRDAIARMGLVMVAM